MNKKKNILVIVIVVIVMVGVALYFYSRNKTNGEAQVGSENNVYSKIKQTDAIHSIKEVLGITVYAPHYVGEENKIVFFSNIGMTFCSYDLLSQKVSVLSPSTGFLPDDFSWSPDGKRVIFALTYDEGFFDKTGGPLKRADISDGQKTVWLYSVEARTFVMLNNHLEKIAWSPDGQKIVYRFFDSISGANNISVADKNGNNWRKIIDSEFIFGANVGFLTNERIFYKDVYLSEGEPQYRGNKLESLSLGPSLERMSIIETDTVIDVFGEPEKDFFFYTFHRNNQKELSLGMINKKTLEKTELGVSSPKIVAAISQDASFVVAVASEINGPAKIIKIDTKTLAKEELSYEKREKSFAPDTLSLANDGKTLYFSSNNRLYEMSL